MDVLIKLERLRNLQKKWVLIYSSKVEVLKALNDQGLGGGAGELAF